jgi:hypothetical protein
MVRVPLVKSFAPKIFSFSQAQLMRECQTPSQQQNTVATDESSATNCFAQAEAQSVED